MRLSVASVEMTRLLVEMTRLFGGAECSFHRKQLRSR
jgi:hypothetical protein